MRRRPIILLLAMGSQLLLGGCYEHVVSERGLGGSTHEIYEPNVPKDPDVIDQVLWGTEPKTKTAWDDATKYPKSNTTK